MISNFLSKANKEEFEVNDQTVIEDNKRIEKIERVMSVLVDEIKNVVLLHDKLNNKLKELETQVKALKNNIDELQQELKQEKDKKTEIEEKFSKIEANLSKYISLYEAITNLYNPFVKKNETLTNESNVKTLNLRNIKKQETILIQDSITGKENEVKAEETQQVPSINLPEGNKLIGDTAKREMLFLKYSQEKFAELHDYMKKFGVDEQTLRQMLKFLIIYDPSIQISFSNKSYNSFEKLYYDLINLIDDFNFSEIKNKLFESFKNTPFVQYFSKISTMDELIYFLKILIMNEYINRNQS